MLIRNVRYAAVTAVVCAIYLHGPPPPTVRRASHVQVRRPPPLSVPSCRGGCAGQSRSRSPRMPSRATRSSPFGPRGYHAQHDATILLGLGRRVGAVRLGTGESGEEVFALQIQSTRAVVRVARLEKGRSVDKAENDVGDVRDVEKRRVGTRRGVEPIEAFARHASLAPRRQGQVVWLEPVVRRHTHDHLVRVGPGRRLLPLQTLDSER